MRCENFRNIRLRSLKLTQNTFSLKPEITLKNDSHDKKPDTQNSNHNHKLNQGNTTVVLLHYVSPKVRKKGQVEKQILLYNTILVFVNIAPRVGIEPTTKRLTVACSTTELPRNI